MFSRDIELKAAPEEGATIAKGIIGIIKPATKDVDLFNTVPGIADIGKIINLKRIYLPDRGGNLEETLTYVVYTDKGIFACIDTFTCKILFSAESEEHIIEQALTHAKIHQAIDFIGGKFFKLKYNQT